MGRLTRWPEFLPCVIRDILDLFLLPTADLKCQRSLSESKVTPLYMSVSADIHTSNKGLPGLRAQQEKKLCFHAY